MMSMSRKKCCVPGCVESGNTHQTLHLFPNPLKDRERFNQWVLAIGGNIIGLENEDIYKHRSVCHLHFEEKFCCRYNRLSKLAVPTLNIPGPLSLPKFTYDERRPLREHNYSLIASIHSASTSTEHSVASESDALSSEKQEKENKDPMELTTLVTQAPQHPMEKENQEKVVVCQVSKTVKKHVRVTCEEQKLYQKLIQARIKLSKCRQKIKKAIDFS